MRFISRAEGGREWGYCFTEPSKTSIKNGCVPLFLVLFENEFVWCRALLVTGACASCNGIHEPGQNHEVTTARTAAVISALGEENSAYPFGALPLAQAESFAASGIGIRKKLAAFRPSMSAFCSSVRKSAVRIRLPIRCSPKGNG